MFFRNDDPGPLSDAEILAMHRVMRDFETSDEVRVGAEARFLALCSTRWRRTCASSTSSTCPTGPAGSFAVTDQQESSMENQPAPTILDEAHQARGVVPLRPTWDQLHPIFPPRVTQEEARAHYETRMTIGALRRNTLGMALLVAQGRMPPPRMASGWPVNRQAIEETNRRLQAMREEQAPKVVILGGSDMAASEVRGIAAVVEAQTTFEAEMRAKELRRGLDS